MQYGVIKHVSSSDLQPGDLLFFGSPIHHVAMYVGGGRMVEAPYRGAFVRVVPAARSDFVGAGRPGVSVRCLVPGPVRRTGPEVVETKTWYP